MGKNKKDNNKFFNFKAELGWSEVIALIALIGAIVSLVIQINSNKPDLSLRNTSLIGTAFIDENGNKYHFGFYRTTKVNRNLTALLNLLQDLRYLPFLLPPLQSPQFL